MNFTRNDLVDELSRRMNVSDVAARNAVNHTLNILMDTLKGRKRIEFRGFASFDLRVSSPKIGRNPRRPQDGPVPIPSKCYVRFKASKELDRLLNP